MQQISINNLYTYTLLELIFKQISLVDLSPPRAAESWGCSGAATAGATGGESTPTTAAATKSATITAAVTTATVAGAAPATVVAAVVTVASIVPRPEHVAWEIDFITK